ELIAFHDVLQAQGHRAESRAFVAAGRARARASLSRCLPRASGSWLRPLRPSRGSRTRATRHDILAAVNEARAAPRGAGGPFPGRRRPAWRLARRSDRAAPAAVESGGFPFGTRSLPGRTATSKMLPRVATSRARGTP